MANVQVFGVYTVRDAKGATSTTKINFSPSANIGMATAWMESGAPLFAAIIKGQIVDIGVGIGLQVSGLPALPDPDSDVEEGARFSFRTVADFITGHRIPTFDESKIVSGTANVDTADTDVAAWVDHMIDGHTVLLDNIQPTDERGSDINALEKAKEAHQAQRKV
jgi:hypothetical protein